MAFTKKEQTEAKKRIKKLLKEFDTKTVFVIQRHMSKSGMTRWLDLYLMPSYKSTHFTPFTITYEVAKALNWPYDFKKEWPKIQRQLEKFSKAYVPFVAEYTHRPERGVIAVEESSRLPEYIPGGEFDELPVSK